MTVGSIGTNELTLAETWIESTISGDPTMQALCGNPVRIFNDEVPVNTVYPFVVYSVQNNLDVVVINKARVMATASYLIKAIAVGNNWPPDLMSAAAQIDLLMNAILQPVSGGIVHGSSRSSEYRLVEQVEGKLFRHMGGIYEMWLQSEP
jgi:hypothetical protein